MPLSPENSGETHTTVSLTEFLGEGTNRLMLVSGMDVKDIVRLAGEFEIVQCVTTQGEWPVKAGTFKKPLNQLLALTYRGNVFSGHAHNAVTKRHGSSLS